MSITNIYTLHNCYNVPMGQSFSSWLLDQFRMWEKASGEKKSVSAFARYLGVKQPSLNRWMSGDSLPEYENVVRMSRKFEKEIFDVLGIAPPSNYQKDYWFDGARGKSAGEINKLMGEFETLIKGKSLNRFEIEFARRKFFEEHGVDLFSSRYEEDDDIQYLRENWQDLPIQLRKKIMSEIRENRGDKLEPQNSAQSEGLTAHTSS